MRDFIDIVKNSLYEGEVVDLIQHKQDKAFAGFTDVVRGIYQGEKDFFSTGKFSPFAETFIKSGFDKKFAPKILLDVKFRDYRKTTEARALRDELRTQRFKIMAGEKWGKGYRPKENTNQDMMGGWAEKEISMQEARSVFVDRENSQFGAYQPSRGGFRTSHLNVWDGRGVGFSILAGGYDSRRGDKYGNPHTEEYHIVDNDDDMKAKWNDIMVENRHKITRQNQKDNIYEGWYLTSHGRFVDSLESRHIAEASGQRIFEQSRDDGIFWPVDIGWGW